MNNFIIGFKRFITNKNVVTVIGVLVILVILFFGYSSSIKKQTNPVSVPVAAHAIGSLTEITAEDITYKQVANSMLDENVIRNQHDIIGKYTNVNVTVPEGSVFYKDFIESAENVPGNWIEMLDHDKEELGYYMDVNVESTLGNSVLPGSYIDVYMQAKDENGTIMFGKLMENIKVLVVHDGSGNNVFKTSTEVSTPSKIGFGVNKDLYILLKKAEYLDINLVIVPRGTTVPENDYVIVRSSTLRDYIDAQTITVEEDEIVKEEEKEEQEENTENDKDNKETEENQVNPNIQ